MGRDIKTAHTDASTLLFPTMCPNAAGLGRAAVKQGSLQASAPLESDRHSCCRQQCKSSYKRKTEWKVWLYTAWEGQKWPYQRQKVIVIADGLYGFNIILSAMKGKGKKRNEGRWGEEALLLLFLLSSELFAQFPGRSSGNLWNWLVLMFCCKARFREVFLGAGRGTEACWKSRNACQTPTEPAATYRDLPPRDGWRWKLQLSQQMKRRRRQKSPLSPVLPWAWLKVTG